MLFHKKLHKRIDLFRNYNMILNTANSEICFQQLKSNGKLYLSAAKVEEITDDYYVIIKDPKIEKYVETKRKISKIWIYDNNYDEFESDENDISIDNSKKTNLNNNDNELISNFTK